MKHNYFYFILVIILNMPSLFAQDLSFYHYGLEKGLSQQTIRCILKDSKGFLWLGTQDGLNRFDGNTFRVFRKNESDSLAVSGKFINDIVFPFLIGIPFGLPLLTMVFAITILKRMCLQQQISIQETAPVYQKIMKALYMQPL